MSANRADPFLFRRAGLAAVLTLALLAYGQDPAPDQRVPATSLIRQMAGTWKKILHIRSSVPASVPRASMR
jgi:hypothetical protein